MLLQNSFRLLTLRDFYELFVICFRSLSKKWSSKYRVTSKSLNTKIVSFTLQKLNSFWTIFSFIYFLRYWFEKASKSLIVFFRYVGCLLSTHVFQSCETFPTNCIFECREKLFPTSFFLEPQKWEKGLFEPWLDQILAERFVIICDKYVWQYSVWKWHKKVPLASLFSKWRCLNFRAKNQNYIIYPYRFAHFCQKKIRKT